MNAVVTIITVQPTADDPRPVSVRERQVLKALLRRHELRCISIRDVQATPPAPLPPTDAAEARE